MWDGGSTPVEIAGLLTDPPAKEPYHMTAEELDRAKALLIKQKPLNKFYWTSEYGNMQPAFKSGDIWITYSWPNDYKDMAAALGEDKVEFMQEPSQGILAWVCGFMLGKDTASPIHAHEYVESFIAHDACVDLTNLFAYGVVRLDSPGQRGQGPAAGDQAQDRRSQGAGSADASRAVDPQPGRLPARLG